MKFIDEARAEKKPFFLYLAYCAPHFPLKAPEEDIARYRGKYKDGWEKLREARHQRQIELGIVDAKWPLTPLPPECPMGYAERRREGPVRPHHGDLRRDARSGRPERRHARRGAQGARRARQHADPVHVRQRRQRRSGPRGRLEGDDPGGAKSTVFLGQSWATLNNTPFRRYKHFTHEGGISTPLIVHWPAGIAHDRDGKLETQPGHLVDVMATVVDVTGAKYPTEFKGHKIQPMEGVSLVPALDGKPIGRKHRSTSSTKATAPSATASGSSS